MSTPYPQEITRYGKPTTVWRDPVTGRFMKSPITYVFAWHALSDACPKCRNLNGREWLDQDLFQEVLWDPIWGDIWNLDGDYSMAHGSHQYNCRCQLEVRVDVELTEVPEIHDFMELLSQL